MTPSESPHFAAFSFDIEDWHHAELKPVAEETARSESIVERGTPAILDLLKRHGWRSTTRPWCAGWWTKATSWRATAWRTARCGAPRPRHSAPSCASSARWLRARSGISPVIKFRAPTFSIDRSNPWALDVLREEGYRYDSSVFPMKVRLYGVPGAPVGIYRPAKHDLAEHDPHGTPVEFPVAIAEWGGVRVRVPVGGGFYLRAMPMPLFRASLDRILKRRPFALYLHPREVTPEQRREALGPVDGFISYVNLHTVLRKLGHLLERYRWTTMRGILEREGWLKG